jgi:hypothetical protein
MQFFPPFWYLSPAFARAISSPSLTAEARILPQALPYTSSICSGQSVTGQSVTGKSLSPNTSVLHWHRHSVSAPFASNTGAVEWS